MHSYRFSLRTLAVLLVIYCVPAGGLAQSWDGGGANDNWSTANNWNPNGVPVNNGTASIIFAGSTRLTPFLDQNFIISSLSFTGIPGNSFTLAGTGTLTLGTGGLSNATNVSQSITHAITLNGNQTWSLNSPMTVSGNIDGTGSLTKTGNGILTLTGSSTFIGTTVVSDGSLFIGNGGTTGSVAGTISNDSNVDFFRSDIYTHAGNITGVGSTNIRGGGTMIATGSISGNVAIFPNTTLQVGNSGTSGTINANVTNTGTLIFNRSDNVTSNVIMSSNGNFIKQGAGRLTLGRQQVYSGTTTVEAGTLIANNMYGSPGSTFTINTGASLEARGIVQRPIAGDGNILATGTLLIGDFNNSSGYSFAGSLSVNTQTVQLLDSNVAELGILTTLSGGRLSSLNGIRLGPAAPAVVDASKVLRATVDSTIDGSFTNRGQVIGPGLDGHFLTFTGDVNGAGNYSGNIVFSDGFSPGDSPAIVNFQSLMFDNTSTLTLEIGGLRPGFQHDQLIATSTINLGGELEVVRINGFKPLGEQQFLLIDNQTVSPINGTFTGLGEGATFNADGQLWQISYQGGTGNDLVLMAVPEPTTIVLLCGGLLGLIVGSWRFHQARRRAADEVLECEQS